MKRLLKVIYILLFSLMLNACSFFYPEPTIASITNPETQVVKLWMVRAGQGATDPWSKLKPAFANDHIYTADSHGTVTCVDAQTGKGLWRAHVKSHLVSSPGVGEGRIFVVADDARLYALNEEDGKKQWDVDITNVAFATPVVSAGMVIVKTIHGDLIAMDVNNGKVKWTYHETIPRLILRSGSAPQVEYPLLVAGFSDGKLVTLTVEEGKLLWEKIVATPSGFSELKRMVDIDADPVIQDGVIYVTSFQGTVSAIELKSAQLLWQHNVSSHAGLTVSPTRVFVTESNGRIWAFERTTGNILWRQNDLQDRHITAPAIYENYLVVADNEGYIHWMDQKDGHFVSRQFFDSSGVMAQPEEYKDKLYVYSRNGMLVALALK